MPISLKLVYLSNYLCSRRWQENLIDPSSSIISEIQTDLLTEIGDTVEVGGSRSHGSSSSLSKLNDGANRAFNVVGKHEFYVKPDQLDSNDYFCIAVTGILI